MVLNCEIFLVLVAVTRDLDNIGSLCRVYGFLQSLLGTATKNRWQLASLTRCYCVARVKLFRSIIYLVAASSHRSTVIKLGTEPEFEGPQLWLALPSVKAWIKVTLFESNSSRLVDNDVVLKCQGHDQAVPRWDKVSYGHVFWMSCRNQTGTTKKRMGRMIALSHVLCLRRTSPRLPCDASGCWLQQWFLFNTECALSADLCGVL